MSTKTLIQTITVGVGGAASIDFTSIPATFDDLVLELSLRGTTASANLGARMTYNGAATLFTDKYLQGSGAAAASGSDSGGTYHYLGEIPGASATANVFGSIEIYIPNYLSANYKSSGIDGVQETNGATAYATLIAALWSNAAAINQITLVPSSNNFAQYSLASLYGIRNS